MPWVAVGWGGEEIEGVGCGVGGWVGGWVGGRTYPFVGGHLSEPHVHQDLPELGSYFEEGVEVTSLDRGAWESGWVGGWVGGWVVEKEAV